MRPASQGLKKFLNEITACYGKKKFFFIGMPLESERRASCTTLHQIIKNPPEAEAKSALGENPTTNGGRQNDIVNLLDSIIRKTNNNDPSLHTLSGSQPFRTVVGWVRWVFFR